jgi:hypothetical protein
MPRVSEAKDYLNIGASFLGDAMDGAWDGNQGSEKSIGWRLSVQNSRSLLACPRLNDL